jgi:hypothetical protein
MTFYNKYLKYKNKYNILKEQIGGTLLSCHNKLYFNNTFGTCWNASVQMLFLFGDITSSNVQTNINKSSTEIIEETLLNTELSKCLPFDFFIDDTYGNKLKSDVNSTLVNMFDEHRKRFMVKKDDSDAERQDINIDDIVMPHIRRRQSIKCEKDFTLSFFKLIYNEFGQKYLSKRKSELDVDSSMSGKSNDELLLIILFGIFLCKKLIEIEIVLLYNNNDNRIDYLNPRNSYYIQNEIPMDKICDSLGILIHYKGHTSCFYKCDDKYKYYDSANTRYTIINFDLINFIEIINYHILNNLKFKISQHQFNTPKIEQLNFINDMPFLISIDTNIIYYQNQHDITIQKKDFDLQDIIKQLDTNDSYFKFLNFVILNYSNLSSEDYIEKYKSLYLKYYILNKNIDFTKIEKQCGPIVEYIYIHDAYNRSLLNEAIDMENAKLIELLKSYYNSEIFDTLYKNDIELAFCLIEECTNIDIFDPYQQLTPLLYTLYYEQYELVNLILEKIKNVDIFDKNNMTPLYLAIVNEKYDIAKKILIKSKNVDIIYTIHNDAALDLAIYKKEYDLASLILNKTKNKENLIKILKIYETSSDIKILELLELVKKKLNEL